MNTYFFHPEIMAQYYNCSGRSYQEWKALGDPNLGIAAVYGTLGIIFWASYIPFLFVFIKSDLLKYSCYKIMFYLAIVDIACLVICSFFSAYASAVGMVYCMMPRANYIAGCIGLGLWCAGSTTCMLLGFNRCLDLASPQWARRLFYGSRTYVWLLIPTGYFYYFCFIHTGATFSSKLYAFFFDPFVGMPERGASVDSEHYPHNEHAVHNFVLIGVMLASYSFLCICLYYKTRNVNAVRISRMQRQTFIQSTLICTGTFIAALVYIYMQFLPTPVWVVVMGQICWQFSHGIVGFTYLLFNPTMRSAAARLFCQPFNGNQGVSTVNTNNAKASIHSTY